MKYLLLSLMLLSFNVNADEWNTPDKKLHLLVGVTAGFAGAVTKSPMYGFVGGCGLGVLKEMIDSRTHSFSEKDALITCAGASIGAYSGKLFISSKGMFYERKF